LVYILDLIKETSPTNPVVELQERDIHEWMGFNKHVEVIHTVTDEKINQKYGYP
jgi:hypothetical protein